jgi:hypothetical protein
MGQPLLSQSSRAFWLKVLVVASIYLALQVAVLLGTGDGWQKFWGLQDEQVIGYWDTSHYATLAASPQCGAFYPLWPRLIRWVSLSSDYLRNLRIAIPLSEAIFLATLPLALLTFERIIQNRQVAFCMLVLFALGPNAVFQAIGYSEAIFSTLSFLFLLGLDGFEQKRSLSPGTRVGLLLGIFVLSLLQNLTRPVMVQTLFAIAASLAVLALTQFLTRDRFRWWQPRRLCLLAGTIGVGSLAGYSFYGVYCWRTAGSFFAPFAAQSDWNRALSFNPLFLLGARSRLFDVLAMYVPLLMVVALIALLVALYRQQPFTFRLPRPFWLYPLVLYPPVFVGLTAGLSRFAPRQTVLVKLEDTAMLTDSLCRFSVLYAMAFAGVHSLINFLYNSGSLHSSARHYFGTPYAFVSLGVLLAGMVTPRLNRLSWVVAGLGIVLLVQYWHKFSYGGWLG